MLKQQIFEDMKSAMKAGDKRKLGAIRLMLAAIKQREVDDRAELEDSQVLAVLDKMLKQRRESISQYEKGGRADLAEQEAFELGIIQGYLPEALSEEAIATLIADAITASGAQSIRDMGKVMAQIKPKVQGRADMSKVSAQIKQRLGG